MKNSEIPTPQTPEAGKTAEALKEEIKKVAEEVGILQNLSDALGVTKELGPEATKMFLDELKGGES